MAGELIKTDGDFPLKIQKNHSICKVNHSFLATSINKLFNKKPSFALKDGLDLKVNVQKIPI
jgi:hypothetical protein